MQGGLVLKTEWKTSDPVWPPDEEDMTGWEDDPLEPRWFDSPWFTWPLATIWFCIAAPLLLVICVVGFVVLLPFALIKLVWDFVSEL